MRNQRTCSPSARLQINAIRLAAWRLFVTILTTPSKLHWNYFLALERDMDVMSRYIEFDEANFAVYSIELAHLLFAAASEVDVVAKLLCQMLEPAAPRGNINDYKAVLLRALPGLPDAEIIVLRYGLTFRPWSNWSGANNPDWWRSYNDVKHERDTNFNQATLKSSLNALGALLILIYHYYARKLAIPPEAVLAPKVATSHLSPASSLLQLNGDFYYAHLVA